MLSAITVAVLGVLYIVGSYKRDIRKQEQAEKLDRILAILQERQKRQLLTDCKEPEDRVSNIEGEK